MKQLYEFNNIVLNKSFLRKRTAVNEDHIAKLQREMLEVQAWREDIEKRMKDQFKAVDDHFDENDEEMKEYRREVKKTFDEKQEHLQLHDFNIQDINNTLVANHEDRQELHKKCEFNLSTTEDLNNKMQKQLNEKFQKLLEKQNYAEKELN